MPPDHEEAGLYRKLAGSLAVVVALVVVVAVRSGFDPIPKHAARRASTEPDIAGGPEQIDLAPQSLPEIVLDAPGFDRLVLDRVAEYTLRGRVVSRFAYYMSERLALAPVDLAVAWAAMAEDAVVSRVAFESQRNGFVFWQIPPGGPTVDDTKISNSHMIPASANLRRALRDVDVGDRIEAQGWLVDMHGVVEGRPWEWRTSRSRTDTRGGACELFYVTSLQVGTRVYE